MGLQSLLWLPPPVAAQLAHLLDTPGSIVEQLLMNGMIPEARRLLAALPRLAHDPSVKHHVEHYAEKYARPPCVLRCAGVC